MLNHPTKQAKLVSYFKEGVRMAFKKGELLIRPQDSPANIYFIEKGFIKAYSITKYGEENLHVIRKNGEIFPLIWTFTEEHRDVAYEALENVIVWRQPIEEYLDFLEKNPDVTAAVLELAIRAYRTYAERVNTLEYRSVRERVVSFLLSCSRRFGTKLDDGRIRINAPLRQQDIASSINSTRETTSRELTALMRKNLIIIDDRIIVLNDPKKLQSMI
jgi:CRP/FNR family transcriptional regulator